MILISHRGNINGPTPDQENSVEYIQEAIAAGYNVEIDLWYKEGAYFLGHDAPQYQVDFKFLHQPKLWIHCKDYITLQHLVSLGSFTNFFYHTDEDYVLTSHHYIWAYPGQPGGSWTIAVMPEWHNESVEKFAGVCSDYVEKYK